MEVLTLASVQVTKALQVRSHPLAQSFTDRLIELFDDSDIGWDAARAIGQVVSSDKVLTKKHHAVIKVSGHTQLSRNWPHCPVQFLYAQKFANVMLPRIIEGAKSTSGECYAGQLSWNGRSPHAEPARQNAYLVALTSLIKSIPKTAYLHEMSSVRLLFFFFAFLLVSEDDLTRFVQLMPLLLRGLDLPDAEIRANVIDTLLAVADPASKTSNSIVSEHASSLVATMLRNSSVREMPSVVCRVSLS